MLKYQRGDWLLAALLVTTLLVLIFGDPFGTITIRCHLG
jgi:hypothetical protein